LFVDNQRQVDFLLERGLYVESSALAAEIKATSDFIFPTPFELIGSYHGRLAKIFSIILGEGAADSASSQNQSTIAERILELARDIQELCKADTDALLGAIHLDHSGRYSVLHPLYRSIICELIAKRKAISAEERLPILAAALTADVSMLKFQDLLYRQKDALHLHQQQLINLHPVESAKILSQLGVNNKVWLYSVMQHHELLNGRGYPNGLLKQDVCEGAKIVKLADVYTALITPKAYRKAVVSKIAMREIFVTRGTDIDEELALFLIKELGVYPPGAFVKLLSGELAIVIHRSINPKAPLVKAVVGPRGAPYDRPSLRKSEVREFEIVDVVERDTIVKFNMDNLWDY